MSKVENTVAGSIGTLCLKRNFLHIVFPNSITVAFDNRSFAIGHWSYGYTELTSIIAFLTAKQYLPDVQLPNAQNNLH